MSPIPHQQENPAARPETVPGVDVEAHLIECAIHNDSVTSDATGPGAVFSNLLRDSRRPRRQRMIAFGDFD